MTDRPNERPESAGYPPQPSCLGERLLAEYGGELDDPGLTEAQRVEFLIALWQIMRAFAEAGFSVKAGDKFSPDSDIGFDDVLNYLIPVETAHETVASEFNNKNKE